jgi:hypothetical protein
MDFWVLAKSSDNKGLKKEKQQQLFHDNWFWILTLVVK